MLGVRTAIKRPLGRRRSEGTLPYLSGLSALGSDCSIVLMRCLCSHNFAAHVRERWHAHAFRRGCCRISLRALQYRAGPWQHGVPREEVGDCDLASNDEADPDVARASRGDIPRLETLAADDILGVELPFPKLRAVCVIDLMRLEPESEHPQGVSATGFDTISPRLVCDFRLPRISEVSTTGTDVQRGTAAYVWKTWSARLRPAGSDQLGRVSLKWCACRPW